MTDPIQTIAAGGNPEWTGTFKHAAHGELTFRAKLPKGDQLTEHSLLADALRDQAAQRLSERLGVPVEPDRLSVETMLMLTAQSGILVLMERPVIREERVEDPENPDREKVVLHRYDPREDTDETFAVRVWTEFSRWRRDLAERVEELGKSSGGTTGSA